MATQRIYVGHMRNKDTGETQTWDFPIGVTPKKGDVLNFLTAKAVIHDSAISITCPGATTPDIAAPVWNNTFTPPTPTVGAYEVQIPFSALDPASGQSITGIRVDVLESYLTQIAVPAGSQYILIRGTVPAGTTTVIYKLTGLQTGSKETSKTFELAVAASVVYLRGSYNAATNILTWYEGQAGSGKPTIQLDGPEGWTQNAVTQMNPISPVTIGGQSHPFSLAYGSILTGKYYVTTVWLGQTLYGSFDLNSGAATDFRVILSTTSPSRVPDTPWIADGSPEVQTGISAVDWRWERLVSGGDASNRVYTYYKSSGPIEIKMDQSSVGLGVSDYSTGGIVTLSNDPGGYQYRFDINNAPGLNVIYYARLVGDASTEISFTIHVPSGASTARTQLYPTT